LEDNIKKIPILYAYLHLKIKEKNKTNFTNTKYLKEVIRRVVVRGGGYPRFIIKHLIEELIELDLLERVNSNSYKIKESSCDNRIRLLINSYF